MANNMTRTYRLVESHRATRDLGAVRTVRVETVTAIAGGVRVDGHVVGHVEGTRIDQRYSSIYPGVELEAAHAYRVRHGYTVESPS